jgi:DNA-binding transcriptional ArsR family regulator
MKQSIYNPVEGFKAVGDGTRYRILKILSEYKMLCVNAIAEKLKISQPVASQHLKILKISGLVEAEKMGNHMHYSVKKESICNSIESTCQKAECRKNKILKSNNNP